MVQSRPALSFYLTMFLVIIVIMLMHEIVHWLVGTTLGYEMYFTLTTAGVIEGGWRNDLDYAIVSISGPIFTFLMGAFGAWLAISKRLTFGYDLIFVAFMQRFLAMIMSAIATPNDEARVSIFLGLDWWVLPVIFVIPLLALTIWSSKVLRFGLRVNFFCYLTVSVAFTLIVFFDGQLVGFERPSIFDAFLPESVRFQQ